MGIDYSIVGERLKKARHDQKLTQEKLAEKLDVSVAYISRVESGSSHVNLKRLNQLCTLLDVSESYILTGAAENSKSYLDGEFKELLEKCTPEQQKLIYNIAKTIINSDK